MSVWTTRIGRTDCQFVVAAGGLRRLGALIAAAASPTAPSPETAARPGAGTEPTQLKRRVVVVTDDQVAAHWLPPALESLQASGLQASSCVIPAGETSKSPARLAELYAAFATAGLTRGDWVVALGGGVVGDLAGYAAATWLRGVPLAQVPTTLLAQVDSAIGGKTGIDLPQGKNLVGAFYQPRLVVADADVLATLPPDAVASGMSEVIKYGLIGDPDLLRMLAAGKAPLTDLIERCVRAKAQIVAADEQDTGQRLLLNFGHTIGHALEQATDYLRYTHGAAVALGMLFAARLGERLDLSAAGTHTLTQSLVRQYHLPVHPGTDGPPLSAVLAALSRDKKNFSGQLALVLVRQPGTAFVHPLPLEQAEQAIAETWHELHWEGGTG